MKISEERDFTIRRWSNLLDLDWRLLSCVLSLIIVSLFLLKGVSSGNYLLRQVTFLFPAFFIGIITLFIRIKSIQNMTVLLYVINLLLLSIVLISGSSAMGAQRWLNIGVLKIQPSEISKVILIISLAYWFSTHKIKNYLDILLPGLIVIPPFLLVFKQPDLGTSLAFIAIYLGMSYWAGATITHFIVILSPIVSLITNATGKSLLNFGTVQIDNKFLELNITECFIFYLLFLLIWLVVNYKPWNSPWIVLSISLIVGFNFIFGFIRPFLWNLLHPYQQKRFTIFLNPESDPQGAGYHIIQSILAIGNGGFFGYGWQEGRLTKGNYVPAQHTDFIFSTIGEEFGFIGSCIVVLIFTLLLWRILYIAKNSTSRFASLIAVGIFSLLAFHIFINIGMTIGIMPITGVPLPFLSYGGTALVVYLFAVFLLLSISYRTLPKKLF